MLVMAIVYSSDVTESLHTQPGSGIDDWAALVLEIVATALFVMVILTVATDERAAWKGVMAPFLIGLFIFTAAATVGPASGGSFNPARSLDPVLCNQEWGDVWIYIVGPLAGGVLGAAIWAFVCLREPPTPDPQLETAREDEPEARLASARGEVLVVLHRRPASAPAPPDRVEGADEGAALVRHAGPRGDAVEVRDARAVRGASAGDVRVLDRVDVDRAPVRMLGPAARALDVAAVERGGVVGLDRAEVAAAVRVDGHACVGSGSAWRRAVAKDADDRSARRPGGRSGGPSAPSRRSPSARA